METKTYDTSRLFTTDIGPECNDECPKCDCDGRDVGDIWYDRYQVYSWVSADDRINCGLCECKLDDNGMKYADCQYETLYGAGDWSESCSDTITNEYQCHEQGPFTTSGNNIYFI